MVMSQIDGHAESNPPERAGSLRSPNRMLQLQTSLRPSEGPGTFRSLNERRNPTAPAFRPGFWQLRVYNWLHKKLCIRARPQSCRIRLINRGALAPEGNLRAVSGIYPTALARLFLPGFGGGFAGGLIRIEGVEQRARVNESLNHHAPLGDEPIQEVQVDRECN